MATVDTTASTPPASPRRPSAAATLAAANAGGKAAGELTVTPTLVAAGVQSRAIAAGTAQIIEALRAFAQGRQATIIPLLQTQLAETFVQRSPDEIAKLLGKEQAREAEFLRRQAARLERDLPKALAETDVEARTAAVNKLMAREQRYMGQRERAMTARAHSVVQSLDLEEASPEGAFWMLGASHHHTPGCVAMANKFWPWPVLRDVIQPPVHPGCPCHLIGLDEAVARGFMSPEHLPEVKDALLRARRNMALEEAIRDDLHDDEEAMQALLEAYLEEAQKRYAKGLEHGGEFMPSVGGDLSKAKGALKKLLPHGLTQRGQGRHVWLKGHHTFVPHDREFKRKIGGTKFTSPAGSTNVYRDGKLASIEGEAPTHHDLTPPSPSVHAGAVSVPTDLPAAGAEDAAKVRADLANQIEKRLQTPKAAPPIDVGQNGKAAHDALLASGFVVRPSKSKGTKNELRMSYISKSGHELGVAMNRDSGRVSSVQWKPDLMGGLYPHEWTAFQAGKEPVGFSSAGTASTFTGKAAGGHTGAPAKPFVPKPPAPPVTHEPRHADPVVSGPIPNYDHVQLTVKGDSHAGGSTGAKIATAGDGSKYLLKTYGGDQDRIATELLSNAVYRALGAKVADAGVRHLGGKEPDFSTIKDVDLGEKPIEAKKGQRTSSGIILRHPNGDVTIFEPKGHFGGYEHSFPKGGVEDGLTPQQNAHKELWEETGLHARITGVVGDYQGDTSVSRYYEGVLTGGEPTNGPETASVKTVPPDEAEKLLNKPRDKQILSDALARPLPDGPAGPDNFPDMKAATPALTYPLLEGKPTKIGAPSADLGKHYMADALLANWDFVGLADDNVLWGPDGKPIRVDQGGTLQFRAQGGSKPFGPVPSEVWSMMSPKGQGFGKVAITDVEKRGQAGEIAKRLTPEKIDTLVDAAPFKDEAMRGEVREALKQRVEWMGRFAKGEENEPEPLHGDDAAEELVAGQADLRLFPEQENALHDYEHEADAINANLLDPKGYKNETPEQKAIVKELDSLLKHTKTTDDVTAYAGMDLAAIFGGKDPGELVGKTLNSRGYLDLTLSHGEARTASGVMSVLVPSGSKALYTRGIPGVDVGATQPDLIGARNSRLRIVATGIKDGKPFLEAVMLP